MRFRNLYLAAMAIICLALLFTSTASIAAKLCNVFLCRIGGAPLQNGDEVYMAKFDVILCNKMHYNDIKVNENTWKSIKKINPDTKIYLYFMLPYVEDTHDSYPVVDLNDIGRYGNARGHSKGDLNNDNPQFFLKDATGKRIQPNNNPHRWLLDLGSEAYHDYLLEALLGDHVGKPWIADGIYFDGASSVLAESGFQTMPAKYDENTWPVVMNNILSAMAQKLRTEASLLLACNRGGTRRPDGYAAWLDLDGKATPPDALLEEGAFAVAWGTGDVQFYGEPEWKRQVDLLGQIHKSKVLYLSHSDLAPGGSGVDNFGRPVSFKDVLWYALGSFMLGRNDNDNNSYFMMSYKNSYNRVSEYYYEEFDALDFGNAAGSYQVENYSGKAVYRREFSKGYVYVNPNVEEVANIRLPESCKQLLYENFNGNPSKIRDVRDLTLKGHRAAFLYKSSNYKRLKPPKNLRLKR